MVPLILGNPHIDISTSIRIACIANPGSLGRRAAWNCGAPHFGMDFSQNNTVGYSICGFPKIMGTFLGVPIIRTIVFWGLLWGTTI